MKEVGFEQLQVIKENKCVPVWGWEAITHF